MFCWEVCSMRILEQTSGLSEHSILPCWCLRLRLPLSACRPSGCWPSCDSEWWRAAPPDFLSPGTCKRQIQFKYKAVYRDQYNSKSELERDKNRVTDFNKGSWLTWAVSLQCGMCWMPEAAAGLQSENWQAFCCLARWWSARSTSASLKPASRTYRSSSLSL